MNHGEKRKTEKGKMQIESLAVAGVQDLIDTTKLIIHFIWHVVICNPIFIPKVALFNSSIKHEYC